MKIYIIYYQCVWATKHDVKLIKMLNSTLKLYYGLWIKGSVIVNKSLFVGIVGNLTLMYHTKIIGNWYENQTYQLF